MSVIDRNSFFYVFSFVIFSKDKFSINIHTLLSRRQVLPIQGLSSITKSFQCMQVNLCNIVSVIKTSQLHWNLSLSIIWSLLLGILFVIAIRIHWHTWLSPINSLAHIHNAFVFGELRRNAKSNDRVKKFLPAYWGNIQSCPAWFKIHKYCRARSSTECSNVIEFVLNINRFSEYESDSELIIHFRTWNVIAQWNSISFICTSSPFLCSEIIRNRWIGHVIAVEYSKIVANLHATGS